MKTAMLDFLKTFREQDTLLFWSTAYTAMLLVLSLGGAVFDDRLVTGTNPWLKPIKFEISIIVFNLTVRWMLTHVHSPLVSAVIAIAMMVEDVGCSASAADPANPENAKSKAETIRVRMSKTFILQRPIEL